VRHELADHGVRPRGQGRDSARGHRAWPPL
jgi:hypothetical protein